MTPAASTPLDLDALRPGDVVLVHTDRWERAEVVEVIGRAGMAAALAEVTGLAPPPPSSPDPPTIEHLRWVRAHERVIEKDGRHRRLDDAELLAAEEAGRALRWVSVRFMDREGPGIFRTVYAAAPPASTPVS